MGREILGGFLSERGYWRGHGFLPQLQPIRDMIQIMSIRPTNQMWGIHVIVLRHLKQKFLKRQLCWWFNWPPKYYFDIYLSNQFFLFSQGLCENIGKCSWQIICKRHTTAHNLYHQPRCGRFYSRREPGCLRCQPQSWLRRISLEHYLYVPPVIVLQETT